MRDHKGYQVTIVILLAVIALQWLLFVQSSQKRTAPVKEVKKRPAAAVGAKIALVLDDWGYNRNNLAALKMIRAPLTLAILPRLPFTHEIAQEAHEMGWETILHLPMEPHEKIRLEKDTILTSMNTQTLRAIVSRDIDDLAHIRGVSNHMGSKATEDARVMGALFAELKKRQMYFLDSFVSAKSVCAEVARRQSIPFTKRDVFLDNTDDAAYIKSQINKLAKKARRYTWAVGIGHDRAVTLQVLREMIPALEKEGYVFVRLSDLVRN